jgi:ubiquinone/menaquinone biosynthesis C-methylase UbiE
MSCNSRVLDIGSGNGLQVGRLTQRGVFAVGCDISFALLRAAKDNMVSHGIGDPMLVQWDGFRMPFASNAFDRVTTNTVLQHVVDDNALDSMVGETARILQREGLLLICELVSPRDLQTAPHVKMRSTRTYGRTAARHGFRIASIRHVASTYATIQCVYGRFAVRAPAPSRGEVKRDTSATRHPDKNRFDSSVKHLARRVALGFSKMADRLVGVLHLGNALAGQDEIVFEKERGAT